MSALTLALLTDQAWTASPALRWTLTISYVLVLGLIAVYGMHRWWLVWLFYRTRRQAAVPQQQFEKLPLVTVQLPMFNESRVAERIIDAACRLDYPRHLMEIQVLDDSTDESAEIARRRCVLWASRGVNIQYIHRPNREGFKAGALAYGLNRARGELVAIFDADFVPEADFLKRTIDYFTDPAVGMVQTRWDHLNKAYSLLTRSQAIFLDGHFIIEHSARNHSRRWFNFNGTAGLWRRQAIESVGGWRHDTLTEDVNLSYRAQLAGWKFIYLPRVGCPAELPPEIVAFKSQQHRWTKGSIQNALKLLPTIFEAPVSWAIKTEAFFHLTSPMVYLYMTIMVLLFYPVIALNLKFAAKGSWWGVLLGMNLFAMGTVSASAFYMASQRERGHTFWHTLVHLPLLMAIGVGIALNNARACLEALIGHETPFVRTPKYGATGRQRTATGGQEDPAASVRPRWQTLLPLPSIKLVMALLETAFGLYMVLCIWAAMQYDNAFVSVPFLVLFAAGYFYIGLTSLWCLLAPRRKPAEPLGIGSGLPEQPA